MTVSETIIATGLTSSAAPARRKVVFPLAVMAAYVLIGVIAFRPVLPGSSQHLFGSGADSILATWFLAWVPHSLANGLNPFFSHSIFVPTGVNLAQNTEGPFLGLLTAPLAVVFGPVARANLLMVLAMPISASAAFVVLRKWQVWGPAAALGGLMYGFAPYAVGQSLGHLVLVFIPLPPFIALTTASILQRRGSPLRLGIQLGLLLTAQFLSEPEIFSTVVVLTVWAVVCVALRHPSRLVEVVRPLLRPISAAVAVAIVLLAYPVWMMLAGPQHYVGAGQPTVNPFHNDLLSFVAPGPLQRVSLGMRSLGVRLIGGSNASEAVGYIGIPVLALAAILAWRSRRSPRMQLAVVVLFGAAILSLGPHLAVDGRLTPIPLPFLLVSHLPLLDNILPSRMSLEVDAGVAAVIAFGLDDIRRAPTRAQHRTSTRQRRGVLFVALALALVVVTQFPQWPYGAQPVRVLPEKLRQAVPPGDPVAITYPYASPVFPQPMLWQAEDSFAFRLIGGYAEHPSPGGGPSGFPNAMNPPQLELFLSGQEGYDSRDLPPVPVSPELVINTRRALSKYDIRLVVVDRSVVGAGRVVDLFTRVLGQPKVSVGSFILWASRRGSL